jgi:hypothetical protein
MHPIDTLQALHDSEINFTLDVFYDGCVTVKLGDESNGYKWEATFPDLQAAIAGLADAARRKYPDSEFARHNGFSAI